MPTSSAAMVSESMAGIDQVMACNTITREGLTKELQAANRRRDGEFANRSKKRAVLGVLRKHGPQSSRRRQMLSRTITSPVGRRVDSIRALYARQDGAGNDQGRPKLPTHVRATPFCEFCRRQRAIGSRRGNGATCLLRIQPMLIGRRLRDVANYAVGAPVNGTVGVAGPEKLPMSDFAANTCVQPMMRAGHSRCSTRAISAPNWKITRLTPVGKGAHCKVSFENG